MSSSNQLSSLISSSGTAPFISFELEMSHVESAIDLYSEKRGELGTIAVSGPQMDLDLAHEVNDKDGWPFLQDLTDEELNFITTCPAGHDSAEFELKEFVKNLLFRELEGLGLGIELLSSRLPGIKQSIRSVTSDLVLGVIAVRSGIATNPMDRTQGSDRLFRFWSVLRGRAESGPMAETSKMSSEDVKEYWRKVFQPLAQYLIRHYIYEYRSLQTFQAERRLQSRDARLDRRRLRLIWINQSVVIESLDVDCGVLQVVTLPCETRLFLHLERSVGRSIKAYHILFNNQIRVEWSNKTSGEVAKAYSDEVWNGKDTIWVWLPQTCDMIPDGSRLELAHPTDKHYAIVLPE